MLRSLRLHAFMIVCLLAPLGIAEPARAQAWWEGARAGGDLRALVNTLAVLPASSGQAVVAVTVQNRSQEPLDIRFDCRLLKDGAPAGRTFGIVTALAPHRHRIERSASFPAGPSAATCYIAKITPVR